MAWPPFPYSRSRVNKAGSTLINKNPVLAIDRFEAYRVVNLWRASHGYPINTFQATLRNRLKSIDSDALVVQRLKRMPSIKSKLERFGNMNLARMQDIGGLRAVVLDMKRAYKLSKMYKDRRLSHDLVSVKDYIEKPKSSGYRSIHLVYRYKNHRAPKYNGLLVELQIRTRPQHVWATAVETMGTFLESALKSSEGPEKWLKFFSLSGAAFAKLEKTSNVPGFEDMPRKEIYKSVTREAHSLKVRSSLSAFTFAVDYMNKRRAKYHLGCLILKNDQLVSFHIASKS